MEKKELLKKISVSATAMLSAAMLFGGAQDVSAKTQAEMNGVSNGAISVVQHDETYGDFYEFKFANMVKDSVSDTYNLIQISDKADFSNILDDIAYSMDSSAGSINISQSALQSGKTYYIRVVPYSYDYNQEQSTVDPYEGGRNRRVYGAKSEITFTAKGADVIGITTEVSKKAITVDAALDGNSTGIQVYRATKNGKYKRIATVADTTYTDKGLSQDTAYQYRVRSYTKNPETGEVTYGAFKAVSSQTWNKSITAQARATSASKVKVTWNKVAGVDGYEVLKMTGESTDSTVSDSLMNDSFESYTLVKDIKKAKKTSYVDKKLKGDQAYTYVVRAYKEVNGSKVYVSDAVTLNLDFGSIHLTSRVENADGSLTVKWDKVSDATKYRIEKQVKVDTNNDGVEDSTVWQTIDEITGTSITLGSEYITYKDGTTNGGRTGYCITPMKGDVVGTPYYGLSTTNTNGVSIVTNVNAVTNQDGSISLSWNPVAGAAYYEVYRTTSTDCDYNKSTGVYDPSSQNGTVMKNYYDINGYNALSDNDKSILSTDIQTLDKRFEYTEAGYSDYTSSEDVLGYYQTSKILGTTYTDKAFTATGKTYTAKTETWNSQTQKYDATYTGLADYSETVYEGPKAATTYTYYVKAYAVKDSNSEYNSSTGDYSTAPYSYYSYTLDASGVPTYGETVTTAVNVKTSNGSSKGYGKPATATTVSATQKPAATKLKSAVSKKAGQVSLKWKRVNGASAYVIYRAEKKNGTYTVVEIVDKKNLKYTDKQVDAGKYFYKVATVKTNEAGADVVGKMTKAKAVTVK